MSNLKLFKESKKLKKNLSNQELLSSNESEGAPFQIGVASSLTKCFCFIMHPQFPNFVLSLESQDFFL